jgi:hypothetical protein
MWAFFIRKIRIEIVQGGLIAGAETVFARVASYRLNDQYAPDEHQTGVNKSEKTMAF